MFVEDLRAASIVGDVGWGSVTGEVITVGISEQHLSRLASNSFSTTIFVTTNDLSISGPHGCHYNSLLWTSYSEV